MIIVAIASCQTTRPLETKIKAPVRDRFSELIKQLGDDDWQTREVAQQELIELGEKLIEQYRKAKLTAETQRTHRKLGSLKDEITKLAEALREARQDKDAEIRLRTNLIRRHLYRLTQPKIAFVSYRDDPWRGAEEIYIMDCASAIVLAARSDP